MATLTSQGVRKRPPWLDVLGYSLSPYGLGFLSFTVTAPILILLVSHKPMKHSASYAPHPPQGSQGSDAAITAQL